MKPMLSGYGNVNCTKNIPDGYQVIYGMLSSTSDTSEIRCKFWDWVEKNNIEHYHAVVGFENVETKYFPSAHFNKPAHIRPIEEILISLESARSWAIYSSR